MDQSAFRTLLAGQTSSSSSSSHGRAGASSSSRGAFGGSKQRLGIGSSASLQRNDHGIPSAVPHKSSVDRFKPRQHKLSADKGKGKEQVEDEEDKPAEPSYKRYGYTDRASMRRAGFDDGEAEAEVQERRPKGLDLSKLDPLKRQLLGIEEPVEDEASIPPEEPMPLKTEEEIERELLEAEATLRTRDDNHSASPERQGKRGGSVEAHPEPPQKKQKRSRADMLRDLQAKIAASTSGATESKVVEPNIVPKRKPTQDASDPAPPVVKGFKVIERAPEKKKRKKVEDNDSLASNALANSEVPVMAHLAKSSNIEEGHAKEDQDQFDDDDNIFGDAGDYDDGLSAEEGSVEEGEERPSRKPLEDENQGPVKYFDDQEEIIPKFETWRSPTPPPRQRTRSPGAHDRNGDSDDAPQKLQRLEGFSTSQYSARELLDMDKALANEEKRKLKKLKGKDKKEAMERLAELEGGLTAEQKEKDRLNRDAQQYENYEKKKQKKARPEA